MFNRVKDQRRRKRNWNMLKCFSWIYLFFCFFLRYFFLFFSVLIKCSSFHMLLALVFFLSRFILHCLVFVTMFLGNCVTYFVISHHFKLNMKNMRRNNVTKKRSERTQKTTNEWMEQKKSALIKNPMSVLVECVNVCVCVPALISPK